MLLFSTRTFTVDGVTVFPDHADPNQFWCLAAPVTLAREADSNEPQFLLIEYAPSVATTGVKGVGFLHVTLALKISDDTQQGIIGQIRSQFPDADNPRLAPVPFDEGTVQIVSLDLQGSGGTTNQAPPGAFVATEKVLGAVSPSLFGDNNALFALTLSEDGASILEAAFRNGMTPVGAIYNLKFTGVRPALDVKITADLKRCYESFSAGLEGKIYWVSAGIDATFEKLRQDGAIKVEVVSLASDAENQQAEQQAMALFKDQILSTWFTPSLSPATAAAADASSVSLPGQTTTGGHPTTPTPTPTPTPTMGGGATHTAGTMGGGAATTGGMQTTPRPTPTPVPTGSPSTTAGGATPTPSPVASGSTPSTTAPAPSMGGATPALGASSPSVSAGGMTTPTAASAGAAHPTTPTPTPASGGVAGAASPIASGANAVGAAASAVGSAAHAVGAAGGAGAAGANPAAGLPAAAAGAASAASPFGIALKLKYVQQDEQKTVTYEYNRQDAVQRTYAPQGFFGLMLADIDQSKHFLKVDGTDPFFNRFSVNVAPPRDYAAIGLQTAHVALDYGDPASGPVKHGDFTFDTGDTTPRDWSVFEGQIHTTQYRYTADYAFDPESGWVGEMDRYQLPAAIIENRQLVLDPHDVLGFLRVSVTPGHIDPDLVDRIDVALSYAARSGWTTGTTITVRPGAAPQDWKVRISDKSDDPTTGRSAFEYSYTTTCVLKTGAVFHAGPFTTTARAVVVDDPFAGAINLTVQPSFDATTTKLAIVEIAYHDGDDYEFEDTLQFQPGATAQHVRIPVLDRSRNTYEYRITTIDTADHKAQGSYVQAQDPLVLVGATP
jgi:hypothetical protein